VSPIDNHPQISDFEPPEAGNHARRACDRRESALRWGDVMAQARQSGFALSVMDGFFAATALVGELVLATRNTKDFAPLGVPLFNPWTDESEPG
jgi:predicted nucleic acid-binding protein